MYIYLDFLPHTALDVGFLVSITDLNWTVEQLKLEADPLRASALAWPFWGRLSCWFTMITSGSGTSADRRSGHSLTTYSAIAYQSLANVANRRSS